MNWTSIVLITTLLIGPCNSNQNAGDGMVVKKKDTPEKSINPPDGHPQSGKKDETTNMSREVSDLIITFSSRGEGINGKAKKLLHDFIDEFESQHKIRFKYDVNSWGREGERDYCFDLKDLDNDKQELFVTQVKRLLEEENLVTISKNKSC